MTQLSFPTAPMLARLASDLPVGPGWRYEPKWDGIRLLASVDGGGRVTLVTRRGARVSERFPEVVTAMAETLPSGSVADGELVADGPSGPDFDAVLHRLWGTPRARAAQPIAVCYVVFDLLRVGGVDISRRPLRERRRALEQALTENSIVQLEPQTDDLATAGVWLNGSLPGIEGVVAKLVDDPYRPGFRGWVKVKVARTADLIVAGHRGTRLVLAMYEPHGGLHLVGDSAPLTALAWDELSARIRPATTPTIWGRRPGLSRWAAARYDEWMAIEPTVVGEFRYTVTDRLGFRYVVHFVRWRPDRDPLSCLLEDVFDPPITRLGRHQVREAGGPGGAIGLPD